MESTVLQRIKSIIEKSNISITTLSKEFGVVQTTLNRQLKGDVALSCSTIEAILHYFEDISAEWLLRGEGSMYRITEDDQPLSNAEKLLAEFAYQTELIVKERDEEIRKLRLENAMLVAEANVRKAG